MKLDNILTPEQEHAGLLVHDDEDWVYLTYGGKVSAIWHATTATPELIEVEAQNVLAIQGQMKPADSESLDLQTNAV